VSLVVGPPASDTNLNSLMAVRPSKWPFAIQRFVEFSNATDPISAAIWAATHLLGEYHIAFPGRSVPVSVGRLCALLAIKLVGEIPIARSNRTRITFGNPRIPRLIIDGREARIEVRDANAERARISVAHEIGHFLIHRRGADLDRIALKSDTSREEEAIAEFIGRMLLMPPVVVGSRMGATGSKAAACVTTADLCWTTLHSSAARLSDPDRHDHDVAGTILWRIDRAKEGGTPIEKRLSPHWHLCPHYFIPVHRCTARSGSVVAKVAAQNVPAHAWADEDVRIGSFSGRYLVDAFGWGSWRTGTRQVLSVFSAFNGDHGDSQRRQKSREISEDLLSPTWMG
jgi:hypothetical protein